MSLKQMHRPFLSSGGFTPLYAGIMYACYRGNILVGNK